MAAKSFPEKQLSLSKGEFNNYVRGQDERVKKCLFECKECNLIFETGFFYGFWCWAMNKIWEAKPQNIFLLKNVVESFFSLWSHILQSLHSKYFFPNWAIDGAQHWFDKNIGSLILKHIVVFVPFLLKKLFEFWHFLMWGCRGCMR